jgi:hypothetical protein
VTGLVAAASSIGAVETSGRSSGNRAEPHQTFLSARHKMHASSSLALSTIAVLIVPLDDYPNQDIGPTREGSSMGDHAAREYKVFGRFTSQSAVLFVHEAISCAVPNICVGANRRPGKRTALQM